MTETVNEKEVKTVGRVSDLPPRNEDAMREIGRAHV